MRAWPRSSGRRPSATASRLSGGNTACNASTSPAKAGLHQDRPGDVVRVGRHIEQPDRAGERMADIDERRLYARGFDEPVQVVGDVPEVGRPRGGVAEPEARAVVGANAGDLGDLGLDMPPGRHAVAGAGVEEDGRAARSVAIEIEPPRSVDRDEILRLGVNGTRHDRLGGRRLDRHRRQSRERGRSPSPAFRFLPVTTNCMRTCP